MIDNKYYKYIFLSGKYDNIFELSYSIIILKLAILVYKYKVFKYY